MVAEMNETSIHLGRDAELAKQLNDEMTQTVLPVTIFVGIECAFGFFGNLLVIYAFLFHYKVCSFKHFVVCLAIVDITCCLSTMPGEMVTQLYWYVYPASIRGLCKVKSFLNVFTVTAEALCLLTISVDRYRKVCRPFGWQIKPRVAKYLCGLLYVLAFLIALPDPFLWGVRSQTKKYKNTTFTVTNCEKDGEFDNSHYPVIYMSIVMTVGTILLVLMFTLCVCVAITVWKKRGHLKPGQPNRDETTSKTTTTTTTMTTTSSIPETDQNSMTKSSNCADTTSNVVHRCNREKISSRVRRKALIMFVLTITFIVTTIIYFVLLTIIASPNDILMDMTNSQKVVYFFFLRFYFINHVINPFVYGLLDARFRVAVEKTKMSISNTFCGLKSC